MLLSHRPKRVIYLPTSSQGASPEFNEEKGLLMVKPADLAPKFADAPLLLALHLAAPRLVASIKTGKRPNF